MSEFSAKASSNDRAKIEPEVDRRAAMSFELKRLDQENRRKFSNKSLDSFSSDPFSSRKASWLGKKELEQSSFSSKDSAILKHALKVKSAMAEEG